MIRLTRINHHDVVVNSDLIEYVEVTPDTVVTLSTGEKIIVLEAPEEIIERVVAFRRRLMPDNPATRPDTGRPPGIRSADRTE